MKRGIFIFVGLFLLSMISFSSASIIFSDGFESGNLNGWTLISAWNATNWTVNFTQPYQGGWHAEDNPRDNHVASSVMEKIIDTTGYHTINFSYYRKLINLDSGDTFRVKWYNGSAWITLEQTNSTINDINYSLQVFNLPASANNNANFKVKFECTANAQNEYCRLDNILVEGNTISTANSNYYGFFHYMAGRDYYVYINTSSSIISFTGLNASNQNEVHTDSFDAQNRFSIRKNFVWFDGWFNSSNLYLNQYVMNGLNSSRPTWQTTQGVYLASFSFNSLPYLGVNSAISANVVFDTNTNQSSFTPVLYSQLATTSQIDPVWNSAGHSFGPMLFQTKLIYNGTGYDMEVSEWVKQDLNLYGLAPRWNVPLQVS